MSVFPGKKDSFFTLSLNLNLSPATARICLEGTSKEVPPANPATSVQAPRTKLAISESQDSAPRSPIYASSVAYDHIIWTPRTVEVGGLYDPSYGNVTRSILAVSASLLVDADQVPPNQN